ncbi:dihydroorotase [Candidatus Woesearchaeota archaeon]|nr:dihydroorotase [Candidatus Woesearchaeota archaeon]
MIDPHVHLRDGQKQRHKETVKHGLYVAWKAGVDAVFEMPNTSPELVSRETIEDRIKLADHAIEELKREHPKFKIWHGLYAGVTPDPEQIKKIIEIYNDHRLKKQRVVGLKMFAGKSVGDLEIIEEEKQRLVYETLSELGYEGVLAVHCEKEAYMDSRLWNPENPFTHTIARPPKAEVESVMDQITYAENSGFKGTFHVCHVSVPETLETIEIAREDVGFKITCGLTPHHAMLYNSLMMGENGLYLKMNPPLRPIEMQEKMLQALIDGRIDWIESDHAPHTLAEKLGKDLDRNGNPTYASGIPGLPFIPRFINRLVKRGLSPSRIDDLTHNNIEKTFCIQINRSYKLGSPRLAGEYEFDPFKNVK